MLGLDGAQLLDVRTHENARPARTVSHYGRFGLLRRQVRTGE